MIKVTFIDGGRTQERIFETEDEAKAFRAELKAKGVKGAKWEW